MPQTSVQYRQPALLTEGQIATTKQRSIEGAIANAKNGAAVLPFGRVAEMNPATRIVTSLDGAPTAGNVLIIPVFTERFGLSLQELAANSANIGYPPDYELVEYITFGDVVMYSEQAVNPGDPVFYRHTAGDAPNTIVGRVRKATVLDETPATALATARFIETTGGPGLTIVRVQTMIGL